MEYSKSGDAVTKGFEQCKLRSYQDTGGVWTIAFGHTRGVGPGLTCIQLQADTWRIEDEGFATAAVNDLVKVSLTQGEFDALVDFVINVGREGFAKSTLLTLLNDENFPGAAEEFAKWDHVNGREVSGLLRRRLTERKEFEGAD